MNAAKNFHEYFAGNPHSESTNMNEDKKCTFFTKSILFPINTKFSPKILNAVILYCRGSIFSFNLNKESWKVKEKLWEKIYAGGNPVVLQPASDHHVLQHNRLMPGNILLINVRSVLTNLLLKYCIEAHLKKII